MTTGLSMATWCHALPYSFLCFQITKSDIRPHKKSAVSLVIADGHLNLPQEFVWINILTLSEGSQKHNPSSQRTSGNCTTVMSKVGYYYWWYLPSLTKYSSILIKYAILYQGLLSNTCGCTNNTGFPNWHIQALWYYYIPHWELLFTVWWDVTQTYSSSNRGHH